MSIRTRGRPRVAPLALVGALAVVSSACERRAADGLRFDPAGLRVGDTVGELVVERADLSRDLENRWVGTVDFAGTVTMRGRYLPHPDYPEVRSTCFEPGETGAALLPRFREDERRVWFCFENQDVAERLLGAAGTTGDATIVVDRFTTVRAFTDAVDDARLIRVLSREPEGSERPLDAAGADTP